MCPGLIYRGSYGIPLYKKVEPSNVRLGWKWLTVTNTLTYCDRKLTAPFKSLIAESVFVVTQYMATTIKSFRGKLKDCIFSFGSSTLSLKAHLHKRIWQHFYRQVRKCWQLDSTYLYFLGLTIYFCFFIITTLSAKVHLHMQNLQHFLKRQWYLGSLGNTIYYCFFSLSTLSVKAHLHKHIWQHFCHQVRKCRWLDSIYLDSLGLPYYLLLFLKFSCFVL